ncbi:MAG TPA: fatty acid hydroxylase, partial [Pseudomonas sp.]|nr:fatty acid hydroxylase [Pseudomonas sp.]
MNPSSIANNPIAAVSLIFLGFILLELAVGCFRQPRGQRRDALIEIIGSSLLLGVTFPLIMFLADHVLGGLLPQARNALAGLPFIAGFGLFLLFDDMTQYWW